ncbi:MAG: aminoacyl-histidine dipeptidase [Epsilonproteobacteria bacterium]|nr:aminoacyl-histidine dipeptidase [Campylobacterota bacterium]
MILEYFKQITAIARCSGNTHQMQEFLVNFAKDRGYKVKVDMYGNILATSQNPKVCFQAHYDMVCIGDYKNIEIIQEDGYLKAKNSTLGADNGIGVAIMMTLMDKYDNLEFLFTNDEEIGLIGAMNLKLKPKAKNLINLDSEDENIYIGCAGGFDVEIKVNTKRKPYFGEVYKISIDSLEGGHSGVDIDKPHTNAIKAIVSKLKPTYTLLAFKGGDRINSIPKDAYALVVTSSKLNYPTLTQKGKIIQNSSTLIKLLKALHHGILGFDREFDVVSKSANLAIVNDEKIMLSFRANSNEELDELEDEIKNCLDFVDCNYFITNKYPALKPIKTPLAIKYHEISKKPFKVIHAGLEIAVFGNIFQQMISIGPNIYNPHSINEKVEIDSIYRLYHELERFLEEFE